MKKQHGRPGFISSARYSTLEIKTREDFGCVWSREVGSVAEQINVTVRLFQDYSGESAEKLLCLFEEGLRNGTYLLVAQFGELLELLFLLRV